MATNHGTSTDDRPQAALLDDSDFLRTLVERMLQGLLETEMTTHIGAEPYERTETRSGHRNGYKPRTLHTRVGTLTLLVPQDREGTFSTALFALIAPDRRL
jgi:transposase-like protein